MDMVLFGAGCMILGGMIGASVGLLMYACCYVSKRGDRYDGERNDIGGSNPVPAGDAALQVLPERMATDHEGKKDARGVLGDFSIWDQWEAQLPLAQSGAYDYVVEST